MPTKKQCAPRLQKWLENYSWLCVSLWKTCGNGRWYESANSIRSTSWHVSKANTLHAQFYLTVYVQNWQHDKNFLKECHSQGPLSQSRGNGWIRFYPTGTTKPPPVLEVSMVLGSVVKVVLGLHHQELVWCIAWLETVWCGYFVHNSERKKE